MLPDDIQKADWLLGSWVPPPDPRRPDFPYHNGLTLTIRPHVPPPPFGLTGYTRGLERQEAPREEVAKFPQSEWCLRNPVAETAPHPDVTEEQMLKIVGCIACKDGRGAQVVRCQVGHDLSNVYVAKIYDPLYYSFSDPDFGTPIDVTYRADQDYSRETAAFEDLKADGADGRFSPKYYGSWTFDMPLTGTPPVLRPVRLVLMEYIKGTDLWTIMERDGEALGFHTVPPEQRLEIFAKAAEAETNLKFHGVIHRDFSPRNVMIADPVTSEGVDSHTPRVILIDFNNSTCANRPNYIYKEFWETPPIPVSPRYNWWGGCPNEFSQWVPEPHRSQDAVFNGWLVTRWPDPSSGYLLLPFTLPRHVRRAGLIEYALPVPDTEPVFAQVYSRQYELPPMPCSPIDTKSPDGSSEAKTPDTSTGPDGRTSPQSEPEDFENEPSVVELQYHESLWTEGGASTSEMKEEDMNLLGVGSNEARTSHEGINLEDSQFTQG
ncbi:EKC/KEOPS complex subunit BUD32 [Fusarium keratoplasticum]|uniref:EKC/KEOPS complex subunit BUD32 n=1 Tax=Fusarium keratoplasticum TaxID=1328300 RepID=A0ACC0R6U4_9HYPO|nr:EKC/KEOPS complex subunit BUD32 [Fusarium keratoplasticum]KAI8675357.1 EKC/KEOPS complex subunit BUD32 [Fusarium keratoplasticum]KAI8681802.1 EKC/KEOPS complex subunit BUD32 [Fusarium keratoplasticum]